ncbi:MAG: type II secretory pathway, component PulD [Nitrospirae bacterium]|nr:MAG: type II secretory pathway, component PulD [Nitrospirota bacterium]
MKQQRRYSVSASTPFLADPFGVVRSLVILFSVVSCVVLLGAIDIWHSASRVWAQAGASPPAKPITATARQAATTSQNGEAYRFDRLEFKSSAVVDALRLIAEQAGINAVATEAAGKKRVTLYLRNVTAKEAIETLAKIAGLWYRYDPDSQTYRVLTTEEYQKDIVIFRDDRIEIFQLTHPNVTSVATVIQNLYGFDRVSLTFAQSDDDVFGAQALTGGLGFGAGLGISGGGGSAIAGALGGLGGGRGFGGFGGLGSRGRTIQPRESTAIVEEEFTPDQIAELERRLPGLKPGEEAEVSDEAIKGLARKEAPIYVTVVRQHNMLIVRTSDLRALEDIKALVRKLDQPTRQVLLEMKILELTLGDNFRSIFDFAFLGGSTSSGPADGQPPNPLTGAAAEVTKNLVGIGNFASQGGTFIYQFLNDEFRARIELFKQDNRIEVLATPMIMASNLRPARIFVGEQRVLVTGVQTNVVTAANAATTTVINPITEIRDVGTTLIIAPTINLDGTVTLLITEDNSTVLQDSTTIPVSNQQGGITEFAIDTVNTANILGTIVAKDGLTIAIGGLIRKSLSHDVQKVPVLGDIPWIGALFRKEVDTNSKTELVLLITPHIIQTPPDGQHVTLPPTERLSRHPYFSRGDQALEGPFQRDPDLEPINGEE